MLSRASRTAARALAALLFASTFATVACSGTTGARTDATASPARDASSDGGADAPKAGADAAPADAFSQHDQVRRDDASAARDAAPPPSDAAPAPCTTRITYGATWFKPAGHAASYDDVKAKVTWDGSCRVDSSGNAVATLSNGWKPVFRGRTCVIALDYSGACPGTIPSACNTRLSYGAAWRAPANHPARHDDVASAVTWDGRCRAGASGTSYAQLSNGWTPTFSGSNACDLSLRYTQCRGLYRNAVVSTDCPDPAVLADGSTYYMVCTPGPAYPIRSSKDLVSWRRRGAVFSATTRPAWAASHFWAPELHKVGARYVVYYSAKTRAGVFAVGAATSTSPTGPFTDLGRPLVSEAAPGVIDAHYFRAQSGQRYILYKVDGNAIGRPTPIKIQRLAADGLSTVGGATTILTNTLGWEGALVEGAWMIERGGYFYLFYSGNGYASTRYATGVARANSPLGPFTKAPSPILSSGGAWAGPGHGAVIRGPSGDWVHVYHAWVAGKVGQSPGRLVLVDRVVWRGGWPTMRSAPSAYSQPLP